MGDSAQLYSIQTVDFDSLFETFKGADASGVHSGLTASVTGSDLTVTIASGFARLIPSNTIGDGFILEFASSTAVSFTGDPDATNPRKALIVIAIDGTITKRLGTAEAASPVGEVRRNAIKPATLELVAGDIVLHEVWLAAGATTIVSADVSDRRFLIKTYDPYIKVIFHDDFLGNSLSPLWGTTVSGTGVAAAIQDNSSGGEVRLATGTTSGSTSRLHHSDIRTFTRNQGAIMKFRLVLPATTNVRLYAGFIELNTTAPPAATNDRAVLRYDTNLADTNWSLETSDGTTAGVTASSIAVTTALTDFVIELTGGNVKLWIDGVLRVTRGVNLPGLAVWMQPFILIQNDAAVDKQVDVDYIRIVEQRLGF